MGWPASSQKFLLEGMPVEPTCMPQSQPPHKSYKHTEKVDTGPLSLERKLWAAKPIISSVSGTKPPSGRDVYWSVHQTIKKQIPVSKHRPLKGLHFNTYALIYGGDRNALIGAGTEVTPLPHPMLMLFHRGHRSSCKSAAARRPHSALVFKYTFPPAWVHYWLTC